MIDYPREDWELTKATRWLGWVCLALAVLIALAGCTATPHHKARCPVQLLGSVKRAG